MKIEIDKDDFYTAMADAYTKGCIVGRDKTYELPFRPVDVAEYWFNRLQPTNSPECAMPIVGQSFGCEWRNCLAVINKNGDAICEKCTKYMKNIAP